MKSTLPTNPIRFPAGTTVHAPMPKTHWSAVFQAVNSESPEAADAREAFCCAYWYPLYCFARRQGNPREEAKDLVQSFFERSIFEKKSILKRADPTEGRLSAFLLKAFKRFINDEWDRSRTRKRGGGRLESLDALMENADDRFHAEPVSPEDTPDVAFDLAWVNELLSRAARRLRAEFTAAGKEQRFEVLQNFLPGKNSAFSYEQAAASLGLAAGTVLKEASQLRSRYGKILREEVTLTIMAGKSCEEELADLLKILDRRRPR